MESCRKAHIPSPKFLHETTGLRVEFSYPQAHRHSEKTTKETTKKTTKKTRSKTKINTTEKIIDLIAAEPFLTIRELSEKIGVSIDGIVWQIKKLKKENRIERVGPDKGGSWKILK